jgi:predicted dinucleotide-binding enzyme
VVGGHDVVAAFQQLGHEAGADVTARADDGDLHRAVTSDDADGP